ncbi:MAG TPA: hypothetical protein VNX88_21235 [Terriglobales bacterium]|nr:hypothetical protein [Terriglobales bacterium]
MRQILSVFLTGFVAVGLAISGNASVPDRHYTTDVRELASQFDSQPSAFEDFPYQSGSPALDLHPFSNEFYLHEFAIETPAEFRRQHSMLAPLANAASGLSKKVASMRRALARMMP